MIIRTTIFLILLTLAASEITAGQTYEEYVQTWSGKERARFVTYNYDTDPNTGAFERAGFVSDRPMEWSRNLGIPGPNQVVDPFLFSSDGMPRAKHVVIMVHGYGPPFGTYFLDRDEDFFTGADVFVHETGATAWFDKSQSKEEDENGLLVNDDAKLYPYLRHRPAEFGFDPDEWVVLAVTINILQNVGNARSILENADRLRALVDVMWANYESRIKTISFVSHSTGSAVVKSVLGERGHAYRNAHPWIAYVDDHINLAGALGGTPAVLLDVVGRHRPIGLQLLYGIQHPDDYANLLDRYTGGTGLATGTYKRTYRWPDHINVLSVAGVWDGGPLLGAPALPVPLNQPLDGNPHTGNGMILIPNETIPAFTPTIWAAMGKSDGVVPNLSVIEQIRYRNLVNGSPWHDQVNPEDHYGMDFSSSWVLPSGGDPAGGGRIGSSGSTADNIPATDRYPGSKITYVEVQAEHNGMLHNEHLMRAIKRRLGTRSVTPHVQNPVIAGLSQNEGPVSGGGTITIFGNHFKFVNAILFGETVTQNFTVNSPSQIEVHVPPGVAPGIVTVRVDNMAGRSGQTAAEQQVHRYTYMGTVANPIITPDGGDFSEPVAITLITQTADAEIYYTWTASEPGPSNPNAKLYTGPFTPPVNPFSEESNFTLRVRAQKASHYSSETVTSVFNAAASANAPVIGVQHATPPNGTAAITMSVTSHPDADWPAHIYYTTNGTDPTYNSTLYNGRFTLGIGNHTVKARTLQLGFNQSPVTTRQINIYDPSTAVNNPIIKPGVTQDFTGPITVSIDNFTEGAIIRYTLAINGGLPHDPPETGPGAITYTGPFQMNIPDGHMYIKARAFKDGAAPSAVVQTGQLNQIVPVTTAGTPAMRAQILNEQARGEVPIGWITINGSGNEITSSSDGGYLLLDHPEDRIISGPFNLEGFENVSMTIDLKRQTGSGSNNYLLVEITNDDGVTWNHDSFITDQAGLNWQTRGPYPFSAEGDKVRIRFSRVDQSGAPVTDGRGVGLREVKLSVSLMPSPYRNTFYNPISVFMESLTPNPVNPDQNLGSNIIYTSDGTIPELVLPVTAPNILYPASGVQANGTIVLKAMAFNRSALADSEIGSADLYFKADRPAISPQSGSYTGSLNVDMSTQTDGGVIRYTLDGSEPNENSLLYTEQVELSTGLNQIIARTFRDGYEPGEITSAVYAVSIPEPPVISADMIEKTLIAGDSLQLSVYVTGSPRPSLQWYRDDIPLEDVTTDSLIIIGISENDGGIYSVSAKNDAGSDSSAVAMIIIEPAVIKPFIETSPSSATIPVGGFVRFDVAVTGRPAPQVQWYRDGTILRGADSDHITIFGVTEADAGGYFAVASNILGTDTSATALLTAVPAVAPFVLLQPDDIVVTEKDTIRIRTEAAGDPQPVFEWFRNGEHIPGAFQATLVIPDAGPDDSGKYFVNAINIAGADTSDIFSVVVEPLVVSLEGSENDLPLEYELHHNYPNPFNNRTNIPYDLPMQGSVEITIYNILGQTVNRVQHGMMPPGRHLQTLDFTGLASGVYLYELRVRDTASPFRKVRKMMLIK